MILNIYTMNVSKFMIRSFMFLTTHSLLSKVRVLFFLCMVLLNNPIHAQNGIADIEKQYGVKVDSVFLKATPYKQIEQNGIIYDEDKSIDWYNNITIYEIQSKAIKNKSTQRSSAKPAIFMIPGGGFFDISAVDSLQMSSDTLSSITFGSKMVNELDVNVYVISYETTPDQLLSNMVFLFDELNDYENCKKLKNEAARAKMEEASYKSFRDLRKILKVNYLDSSNIKGIDPNNFFIIGSSAGAILSLNTLFLQKSEIPSTISYNTDFKIGNIVLCPTTMTATININNSIINDYWPIPQMKAVISMNGAWIYEDSLLTANTPSSSYETWLYLLHGTCDEIVHRREGRISFKKLKLVWNPLPKLEFRENTYPENRFTKGYGSEIIFNTFKTSLYRLRYDQVLGGGHTPFHNSNYTTLGAWEVETPSSSSVNPLSDQIFPFIDTLIKNNNLLGVSANTWQPEAFTTHCKSFDEPLDTLCHSPLGIMYGLYICDETRTALYFNPPQAPFTTDWSVKGNLTVLSTTDTTLMYKRTVPVGSLDTITLKVTRPCGSNEREVYSISAPNSCDGLMADPEPDIYMNIHNMFIPFDVLDLNGKNEQKLTAIYYNAKVDGVIELGWTTPCMDITEPPVSFWIGEHLVSNIVIKSNAHTCDYLHVQAHTIDEQKLTITKNVRNIRENEWKILLNPNPTKDYVVVKLQHPDIQKTESTYPLALVDTRGVIHQNSVITNGRTELNVGYLESGTYKVVVLLGGEVIFATLNVSK